MDSYTALDRVLEAHRARGLRVAVDDVGAGYDGDAVRQALVRALADFGRQLRASVIAEGVETEAERDTLVGLGVGYAQGFLFGVPTTPAVRAS